MAQVDFASRHIVLKLVYCGPQGAGKTTNLRDIARRLRDRNRCRLLSPDGSGPTHFFDLLPVVLSCAGARVVLRLLTGPGEAMYSSTRRLVLRGADGVVFVADCGQEPLHSEAALSDLRSNLRDSGLRPESVPLVVQLNKRDAAEPGLDARTLARLLPAREADAPEIQYIPAAASTGLGVVKTLCAAVSATWDALDREVGLVEHLGFDAAVLCRELTRQLSAGSGPLPFVRTAEDATDSPWLAGEPASRAVHDQRPDGASRT